MRERERLSCGCRDTARTMGTMLRHGRFGFGHYAMDGDFMGECEVRYENTDR